MQALAVAAGHRRLTGDPVRLQRLQQRQVLIVGEQLRKARMQLVRARWVSIR